MTSNTDTDLTNTGQTPNLMALAAEGTHPGWLVLDSARAGLFTGEIEFTAEPEIRVYLDHGTAYHAVRAGDASMCSRLLEAGVVEPTQIDRGVVRVGNVEHLGRLFDRDSSVDRDAVTVFVELATDAVVTEVANRPASDFKVTPYRHHVSGIHRWFVAPSDPSQLAPIGQVAQIDGSVTSNLPGLPVADRDEPVEELSIEWDHPNVGSGPVERHDPPLHTIDESMLQSILDEPEATEIVEAPELPTPESLTSEAPAADWSQPDAPAVLPSPDASTPLLGLDEFVVNADPVPSGDADDTADVDDDFQIVWPDGTEQVFAAPGAEDVAPVPVAEPPVGDAAEPPTQNDAAVPIAAPVENVDSRGADVPAADADEAEVSLVDPLEDIDTTPLDAEQVVPRVTVADDGAFRFEIPPLALSTDATPSEEQPADVVAAVRRALEAIESAATSPTSLRPIGEPDIPGFAHTAAPIPATDEPVDADLNDAVSIEIDDGPAALASSLETATDSSVALPQPVVESSFAPPTLDESAEALYARGAPFEAVEEAANAAPASGVASVVFVDDETNGDGGERSGALRRLIGSLRRK